MLHFNSYLGIILSFSRGFVPTVLAFSLIAFLSTPYLCIFDYLYYEVRFCKMKQDTTCAFVL